MSWGEDNPLVRRDVYPAEVLLPDGSFRTAVKVVVTTERVYVWAAGPVLLLAAPYDAGRSFIPHESRIPRGRSVSPPMTIATDRGVVTVNRGRGCGCGEALKRFRPFPGARRAA